MVELATTDDQFYEEYREGLLRETQRLANAMAILRLLDESRSDKERLAALNVAPAFFGLADGAFFALVILTCDKLFDERSERSFPKFLNWTEQHLDVFSAERHQARRNLAADYWLLNQLREESVTRATVDTHREQIKALEILKSIRTRRDKFWAHSDKSYFAAPSRLKEDAPLSWSGLDDALVVAKDILHTYSGAFDGRVDTLEYMNVRDLELLLDRVLAGQPAET